jgi:hypothetical protein
MTRKQTKKATLLLLLILGLAVLLTTAGVSPKSEANQNSDLRSRVALLNAKARLARSGDEKAVSDLADEVFKQFGHPEMTDALPVFKDRLVRAEINYRRQGKGGISERNLVKALNRFTEKIGAPDYAKVSVAQLRYLRVNLISAFPSFISQPPEKQPRKTVVNPEMSPLEAAGLTLLMVTQKLSNEDFQVTPEEWAAKRHRQQVAKWEARRNAKPAPMIEDAKARVASESARSKELQQVFFNRAADILPLIDNSLEDMGISR